MRLSLQGQSTRLNVMAITFTFFKVFVTLTSIDEQSEVQ